MDDQLQLPQNAGKTFDYLFKYVSLLVFPPFKYVQTLVVLGVEPLPLYLTKTPLGQPMLTFPSIISIARHIAKECGFFHLYTGFPLIVINRVIQSRVRSFLAPYNFLGAQKEPAIFGTYFMENVNLPREDEGNEAELEDAADELEENGFYAELIDDGGGGDGDRGGGGGGDGGGGVGGEREGENLPGGLIIIGTRESGTRIDASSFNITEISVHKNLSPTNELTHFLLHLSKNIIQSSCIRVISLSLSYPFEVLYIRRCAQYVGKEIVYSSILSGVRDVYKNEGIKGFYSGFIPRVLAEMIGIAATQTIFSLIFKPCVSRSNVRFFFNNTTRNLARYMLYPFKLVSVIMAVKPCDRLAASKLDPHFFSWISCWRYLNSTGQLRRGYQVIWRYQRHLSVDEYINKLPSISSISP